MGIAKYDAKKLEEKLSTLTYPERKLFFQDCGINVMSATGLEAALKLSGLDFEVAKSELPVKFDYSVPGPNGTTAKATVRVPGSYATYRTDTGAPLGIVGTNYNILQNTDAFDFLNDLAIAGDAKFETAGIYGDGAKSFITMSTECINLLGDDFKPYILFMNSHDGSCAVKAMFTPTRVFCSNTLPMAVRNGECKINIRHSNSMKNRLDNARKVLLSHGKYLDEFKKQAEKLAVKNFSAEQFMDLVERMYPVNDEDSITVATRNMALRNQILNAYNQHDLDNFKDKAWRAVQAFSDFESHKMVFRHTDTEKYINIGTVSSGMPITNGVIKTIEATA